MNFSICDINPEDSEALLKIALEVSNESIFPSLPEKGIQALRYSHREQVHKIFTDETYQAYKAKVGNEIAGFISCKETSHIVQLYVLRKYQGKGIASALLQQVITENNLKTMTVRSSLNAVAFYEKNGFKASGQPGEINGIKFLNMEYHV